jgi:cysteine desulfurase
MNLDLRGIAISTGSACSSGSPEPSPVILALGLPRAEALEAVRISLGPENTEREVEIVAAALADSVALVRSVPA